MEKAKIFHEEISAREAACRKSVSPATIRNWAKSGKINARKENNRYIIVVDELFAKAQRYQRMTQHLQDEVMRLERELLETKRWANEITEAYHYAMERAENAEMELDKFKVWCALNHCPEVVSAALQKVSGAAAAEWLSPLEIE